MLTNVLNRRKQEVVAWYASVTAPANVMASQAETRVEKSIVTAVRVGLVLGSLMPLLLIVGVVLVAPAAALAQSPGQNLFGSSEQTVGNGIRAFTRWFRVAIFFAGVIGLGVCGLMKMFKQPCGGVAIGSVFCFGFAGVAQLVYSFSNGQEVEFNPELGE